MTITEQQLAAARIAGAMIRALGGPQIFSMAFRHYVQSTDGMSATFHIARGLKTTGRVDRVTVTLEHDDTYSVVGYRYNRRTHTLDTIAAECNVYADSLRAVVESMTGLRMTLGTMDARSAA